MEENHGRRPREGWAHVLSTLACRPFLECGNDRKCDAHGAFCRSILLAGFHAYVSAPSGWVRPSPHRALDIREIPGIVEDYRKAAERGKSAGFDGVELYAGNGLLTRPLAER
jgi:2,4-dienoyl-CoA reductase-like NADH-dependent reductase (Old Yellow Enzyme family)